MNVRQSTSSDTRLDHHQDGAELPTEASPAEPPSSQNGTIDHVAAEKGTVGDQSSSARKNRPASAENGATFPSRLVFQWISELLAIGFRQPLQPEDIPLINPKHSALNVASEVQDGFNMNNQNGFKFPLFWALYTTFKRQFWIGGVCRMVADVLLVTTPYTLRYLIQFAMDSYEAGLRNDPGPPLAHGIAYLVGIVAMMVLQSFAHNHYMYLMATIGGQCRAVLTSALFDKSVRLLGRGRAFPERPAVDGVDDPASSSTTSEDEKTASANQKDEKESQQVGDYTTGRITNLLTVDASRVDKAISGIHICWTAPISLVIAVSLLIVNLGVSALAGLGLLVLGFGVLITAVGLLFRQRKVIDKLTQSRVSRTHEILGGIRSVKYFGWGGGFAGQIRHLRAEETQKLRSYLAVRSAVSAISQALPVMTAMISFVTYSLTGTGLSPAIVFSSVALFTSLRMPMIYMPVCIQGSIDSWASLQRIQIYLLSEELRDHPVDSKLQAAAEVRKATFVWDHDSKPNDDGEAIEDGATVVSLPLGQRPKPGFTLQNIDLTLHRGELLAVMGAVGSGKTSLLSALVGDMTKKSGSVTWGASHAICPQQPWMQNATLRDNITFGRTFVSEWYQVVLHACSLSRDLEILPYGDSTIAGERGVVLSGGQKQRISLARAMYSRAEIVLLDDPLSAVDANVGRSILDDAICGQMKERTRILCTHDVKVLHRCDRILWMHHGQVRGIDTYDNLMATEPEFAHIVRETNSGSVDDAGLNSQTKSTADDPATSFLVSPETEGEDQLIREEDRESRSLSWKVYGALITWSHSVFLVILCVPMVILAQGTTVMTSLWLAWWSSDRFSMARDTYIGIYAGLAGGQVLFLSIFGIILGLCCIRSSQSMLDRAVLRVLRAPISLFDTTPLGRHMNRFSVDVETMDYALPEALRMFMLSLCGLTAIFSLIIAYFHWFAVAVVIVLAILIFLAFYYRATAREVKRHESVLRSVVYARFVEGLSGVSTLRTYNMGPILSRRICDAVDDVNSATFTTIAVQRWLSLRQDAVTILLLIAIGVLVIVDRQEKNPAIAGLVLSLVLGAAQVMQVVVREWADVESALNSTERLHTYATALPQEPDKDIHHRQNPDWPTAGALELRDVRMRYRDGLPEALRGVSLTLHGGEHVAIVGRTGAGKSSIVNAVFRLTELSGGNIHVDGIDISQVRLEDLRSALSIIPQETTLFAGTVRSNLDPFDSASDSVLWEALRTAGLRDVLHLSDMVQDEGVNLSLGQRQLLGLARVVVRGSRILVCDEATSALDTETDDGIQQTMRGAFRDKTVLCIAHRLRTVLWYDRVCVMDEGRVAEIDTPSELFRLEGGIFRGMCLRLGITAEQIRVAQGLE